jgi:ParB family transcriptional regulator, chromosome partitioning protein
MSRKRKQPDEWLVTLLPERQFPATPLIPGGGTATPADTVLEIPNPYQTRTILDEKSLYELSDSIRSIGLLESVVVRRAANGRYQVIAGERRVKACYMAEKYKVPAVVRQVSDQQAMEMTVVENLLREDVNVMDQAHAFGRLADEFGLSHEAIAARTGKGRVTVSNFLRLLQLPRQVQAMLRAGKLSFGHARALLALCDCAPSVVVHFAQRGVSLSVRKLEKLIDEFLHPAEPDPCIEPGRYLRPKLRDAQQDLRETLSADVVIVENMGKGHIGIPFIGLHEFDRLLAALIGK